MVKPLISVIIPIYNIESYLAAAIESIICQDIGFDDNVELILIDDSSTDRSPDIAKQYTAQYLRNITYQRVKKAGVSYARNTGFNLAKGKYIHFFDGDDILSKNFYSSNIKFLKQHQKIDFSASPLKFFDEIIDSHPLNYKFSSSRVIDIVHEPNNPIMHVISCVFRRSALSNLKFDERLSIAEDVKFISDCLMKNQQYGVLADTVYHYRKRGDGSSAIASSMRNKASYLLVAEHVYEYMLSSWSGCSKAVGNFAEYTILYDLSNRLDQKEQLVLSFSEEKQYVTAMLSVATHCSDISIVTTTHLSQPQKLFILRKKHGKKLENLISLDNGVVSFSGVKLYNCHDSSIFVDFLTHINGDTYKIEGYINGSIDIPGIKYFITVNNKKVALKPVMRYQREKSFLGHIYDDGGAFEAMIDIPVQSTLSFIIRAGDEAITPLIHTGRYTRFGALKWTYRRDSGRLFKRRPTAIHSFHYSWLKHTALEFRMWGQILLNWRLNTMRARLAILRSRNLSQLSRKAKLMEIAKPFAFSIEAVAYIPRDLFLRACYYIIKPFKKRPIWLVSDRSMMAHDNGEALFRYIMSRDDCPADVYFVMSKKSADVDRIKSIGKVLYQESLRFKLKFLLADKIIASQADVETTNPFIRLLDRYVDLFNFQFVFLQHGIIRHNLSSWLNRYEKDIALFVTSADKEYNSIFTNPYYYDKSQVVLSGLPRYDYLESEPAGKLILAPTYRKNLSKEKTDRVGRRHYDPTFRHTEYRTFYNNFMNDPRLLSALKDANMTGEFLLHPVFAEQRRDFVENEQFTLAEMPYDYQKAFREGNILVSDHSSVVFDFAYLKKPVVYAHFDVDTFFHGHSYDKSNFFLDEDDGFGSVYYNYDTLVEGVVESIRSGCKMKKQYTDRVDRFFHHVDTRNSERVYNAILELDR